MPAPRDYASWDKVAQGIVDSSDDDDDKVRSSIEQVQEGNDGDERKNVLTSRERKLAKELALDETRNSLRPYVVVAPVWDTRGEAARWCLDLHAKPHFDVDHSSALYAALWDGILANDPPPRRQALSSVAVQTNTFQNLSLTASDDSLVQFYSYLHANAAGLALATSKTLEGKGARSAPPPISLPPVNVSEVTKTTDDSDDKEKDTTSNVLERTDFDSSDFLFEFQHLLDGVFQRACTTLYLSQVLTSDVANKNLFFKSIYDYPGLSDLTLLTLPLIRGSLWIKYLGLQSMTFLANGSTVKTITGSKTITEAQELILETKVVSDALKIVVDTFNKVDDILKYRKSKIDSNSKSSSSGGPKPGIYGTEISPLSSLDISFASHAIHVLLPDKAEFGSKLRITTNTIDKISPKLKDMCLGFRATDAGRHAIAMYQRGRGESLEVSPQRYVEAYGGGSGGDDDRVKFFVPSAKERLDIYQFLMKVFISVVITYVLINVLIIGIQGYQGIVWLTLHGLASSLVSPIIVGILLFTVGFQYAPRRIQERLHRLIFWVPLAPGSAAYRTRIRLFTDEDATVNYDSPEYLKENSLTKTALDTLLKETKKKI